MMKVNKHSDHDSSWDEAEEALHDKAVTAHLEALRAAKHVGVGNQPPTHYIKANLAAKAADDAVTKYRTDN